MKMLRKEYLTWEIQLVFSNDIHVSPEAIKFMTKDIFEARFLIRRNKWLVIKCVIGASDCSCSGGCEEGVLRRAISEEPLEKDRPDLEAAQRRWLRQSPLQSKQITGHRTNLRRHRVTERFCARALSRRSSQLDEYTRAGDVTRRRYKPMNHARRNESKTNDVIRATHRSSTETIDLDPRTTASLLCIRFRIAAGVTSQTCCKSCDVNRASCNAHDLQRLHTWRFRLFWQI